MSLQLEEFTLFRTEVRHGFAYVNARIDTVDCEISNLRNDFKELKVEVTELRGEVRELRGEIKQQGERLSKDLNDAVDAIMQAMERNYNEK